MENMPKCFNIFPPSHFKIVKFHTKCKTWQASHPANFKSGKFNPYPWKLVANKCKKNYIDLFMSALVSQLLFVVFLLCKQCKWFISFFCIGGINMFDFYVFNLKIGKFVTFWLELQVKKLQICQSLWWTCLSICLHGSISKCLSCICVQSVKIIKCVCVSRLPLLQKAHFLPTTPAFFDCSSASLQSFPFLLISMMFVFISSTFSFIPHITHV